MAEKKVRVRFAPSPTGPLHLGGVRTALYNYLFAKKHDGVFILRIEDTDQNRFVPDAEEYIVESLKWCNMKVDEGVNEGGEYGPYRQSERKEIYRKYVDILIKNGSAYYAFDTPEELEDLRKKLEEEKAANTSYNPAVRSEMRNSLSLSELEVEQRLSNGEPYVVRFKMPENEDVVATDLIRNKVVTNSSTLDDKVLFKSDGMPTYHLANVVDDYLMKISHVIRGEEWLPSLPLHILLYKSFGWQNDMPEFAHLPLILKPSGNGKLSKRDGDKLGFPVFPLDWYDAKADSISAGYRENGYFPEAFINMLALLGWNPGTEQEVFSMEELIDSFDINRVSKSGARFDPEKAKWFNHQYLVNVDNTILASYFESELKKKGINAKKEFISEVCGLVKERADLITDLWSQSSFFFESPQEYDATVVKKKWKESSPELMSRVVDVLDTIDPFDKINVEKEFKGWIESEEIGFGPIMNPLRLTLVGGAKGPDIIEIMVLLGKQETLKRIKAGVDKIRK